MNISQLSTEEIIHYIEAGVIESVSGEVVIEIIKNYNLLIEELEQKAVLEFDRGFAEGLAVEDTLWQTFK